MNFNEYQQKSRETAIYPDKDNNFVYPVLGLVGESGEVAEKFKKIIRDKSSIINDNDKEEIVKEMGDVLWYLAQLSSELNVSLEYVVERNLEKLNSRKDRGLLKGDGDNR